MNMTTLNASSLINPVPTASPPNASAKPQAIYNYIGATGPVVLQYNASKGGAVQYKNPN